MLEVRNIRVSSFDLNYLHLTWELKVRGEDPLDYDFYILRSGAIGGPYDTVVGPIRQDSYEYLDGDVNRQNILRGYFYRVRAVKRATGDITEYPKESGAFLMAKTPLHALEIQRQERVLFREFSGRRAVLLPIRMFGTRCLLCWDARAGRRVIDHCLSCFDTSWVGGYLQPQEIYIQIDPSPMSVQDTIHGREVQDNTAARMGNFPLVKPDDVIVESDNTRWRVSRRSTTQRLRVVVHQELQLHRIVPGEIEYSFPIIWPDSLDASPAREFTNPQTV